MLDSKKWIQDPVEKDRFYSLKKNITARHLVVRCTVFEYIILEEIPELPPHVLEHLKVERPDSIKETRKISKHKKGERKLQQVKAALERFTSDVI